MSIGTFGSFTQARLGIYASQAGLSITGNNISNINTPGYTRQKLVQSSLYAGGSDRYYSSSSISVGNGVICQGTEQIRDPYLDLRYRNEMASVGAMDAKLGNLEQIQRILDEVGDGEEGFGILGAQLNDFYKQLQNLNNHTGLAEYDIQVRSSAESLSKLFNSYASQLKEVQKNAEQSFRTDVDSVNSILESIRDLNVNIRKAELHGDPALELRDHRNVLIDELSQFIKIDVTYGEESMGGVSVEKLMIRLGDANPDSASTTDRTELINGIFGAQISVPDKITAPDGSQKDNTMLQIQVSAMINDQGKVYKNLKTGEISTGALLADNDLQGALQGQREFLTESGEFCSAEALQIDPKASVKRGVPFYRKALDLLATQFAKAFNEANQGYVRNEKGEFVTSDGTVIQYNGAPVTEQTPMTPELEAYLKNNGGQFKGKPLFSSQGDADNPDGITAENISISKSWSVGPLVVNSFIQHGKMGIASTDSSNIGHMLVLMNKKMDYLPDGAHPDVPMFNGTFNEMWDNMGTLLGNDMMITKTMLDTYESASIQLNTSRDSVSSVDLNDEAMNLMQYSKSYSASCRLMTTIDTVLEKLINGTGVTR